MELTCYLFGSLGRRWVCEHVHSLILTAHDEFVGFQGSRRHQRIFIAQELNLCGKYEFCSCNYYHNMFFDSVHFNFPKSELKEGKTKLWAKEKFSFFRKIHSNQVISSFHWYVYYQWFSVTLRKDWHYKGRYTLSES